MRRSVRFGLKHLNPSGRFSSGNVRYYYRPKGQKGVAMPDAAPDHPMFLLAYAEAAGVTPRPRAKTGTIAAAIQAYKRSDSFLVLGASTRATRGRVLDKLVQDYGYAKTADLAQRHINADLDKFNGHPRNNRLKVWRGFGRWLHEAMGINDPSEGLKKSRTQKTDGHVPWSVEDIASFRAHWCIGSMERLAFELIFWTGARVSDAVRLGVGNVDSDGWLVFKQQKTGGEVAIPFERRLPEFAEIHSPDLGFLHSAIRARKDRHFTWLHTHRGASRSQKSVSQWFASKARSAGIADRTAHGLRKSRAIGLAQSGGTSVQIGAWTGHESLKEIERYIRGYNKRQALTRTENEQKVPTSGIEFQSGRNSFGESNG